MDEWSRAVFVIHLPACPLLSSTDQGVCEASITITRAQWKYYLDVSLADIHAGCSFQSNSVDGVKTREQWTVKPQEKKFSLDISVNHPRKCWDTCVTLSLPLIILLIYWYHGGKRATLYSHSMTSSQHKAPKWLKFKTDIEWVCQEMSYHSLDAAQPLKEQYEPLFCRKAQTLYPSILRPFTPLASLWLPNPHPGGSGAWKVRQSTQRQGDHKSNFSFFFFSSETINYLKGTLWLWLVHKVWIMLIMVISSVCSLSL